MEKNSVHTTGMEPDGSVILRYIRGEAMDGEKTWVENWLQESEENEKALQQVARIYYAVRTKERMMSRDSLAAYDKVRKEQKKRARKIWLNRIYVAAACFAGVLVMSTILSYLRTDQADTPILSQLITVQANAGMRTHFSLPDGTVAYLNSGSTLSYPVPYDTNERRVFLSGEAYFKVTHNAEQPFIVSVKEDKMRVKVLGTEFNLQAYPGEDEVQTTLVAGAVDIEIMKQGNILSRSELKPSEKATYMLSSGTVSIASVNTDYDTAWKEGRLMFKDMPLPQVLKKLSYFYNVRFEVKDPVINSYCFTGTFENKQLSQVLDYLKISSQIEYTIEHITADDSREVQYTTVRLKKK